MDKQIQVLLVDDEADFLKSVAFWLRSKGYAVTTALNGHEALKQIQDEPPDIVFLDIHMPDMDGLEVLRRIRAVHKDLPVIIVTAVYQDGEHFATACQLGISGFFPKQSRLTDLTRLIESSLRSHTKLKAPPL